MAPGASAVNVNLTGRSALVTGAASGIGRAVAGRHRQCVGALVELDALVAYLQGLGTALK